MGLPVLAGPDGSTRAPVPPPFTIRPGSRMGVLGTLWKRLVLATEATSFALNRWTGIAQYAHHSRYLEQDQEAVEAYCAGASRDVFDYLAPPAVSIDKIDVRRIPALSRSEPDQLTFSSPRPSGIPANDTVRVHRYRAAGLAEGTLVFIHPAFRTGLGWIEWFTRALRQRFDVAVMEAPFHLSRAPEGTFSGERMINTNPIHLFEGLRQWMADHRALLTILESEADGGEPRSRPSGIVGYSLGSYLATMYSRYDPKLPIVGICPTNDYASLIYEGVMMKSLRASIGQAGISREGWERLTSCLRLDPYGRSFAANRMLLFAARYDGVEPWPSIERFVEAVQPRRLVLLPSGHSTTAVLFRRLIMRETLSFLDALKIQETGADEAALPDRAAVRTEKDGTSEAPESAESGGRASADDPGAPSAPESKGPHA